MDPAPRAPSTRLTRSQLPRQVGGLICYRAAPTQGDGHRNRLSVRATENGLGRGGGPHHPVGGVVGDRTGHAVHAGREVLDGKDG
jgi:hypothetical protein